MLRITDISLPVGHTAQELGAAIAAVLGLEASSYTIHRRAVDCRRRNMVLFVYSVDVKVHDELLVLERLRDKPNVMLKPQVEYKMPATGRVDSSIRPVVVGGGPAGLFAGLLLAQLGLRPILLERGKAARERAMDVHEFWRMGKLNEESNVQFGDGGAGTFSDGKLTTQIKDPAGRGLKVIKELLSAGAPEEISFFNKPHIGTDKLINIVGNIRRQIESLGGEVRMRSKVIDIMIKDDAVAGVEIAGGECIETQCVILAIGNSARDTFAMLKGRGVAMEQKPFSIGVRIEHPQSLIDQAQYGKFAGHSQLGAADYKLVHHCGNGRTVYSFCMCPGGEVIAAASEAGGVVTNGMSIYARNKPNANSAILVNVGPADFGSDDVLACVEFQRKWERLAYKLGGCDYKAPAQRMEDFLNRRASVKFGDVAASYMPGVVPADIAGCLPGFVVEALREGLGAFGNKLKNFAMADAVLTGVETRSSSPIRILRGEDGQSANVAGLFPAGEGAGYAGGIVSSAIDGIKAAEAVISKLKV